MKRPFGRWLLGAGAAAGLAALATRWPPINDVKTGATPEYPDLQPRHYAIGPDAVFLAAQLVAHDLPGWKVGDINPATRSFHADAPVPMTPFVDDIWVDVTPEGDGGSVVNVRSKSRVGKGDFGVNERRIRAYLAALDAHLKTTG